MADTRIGSPSRHLFIDVYRTAVILLMLEGHTLRTLLTQDARQTWFFQIHEFIHGLSAPAFLFGSGLTFVISTRRRWKEYHHWAAPLSRRVNRLLLIALIGYAIHLPYFSIRKIIVDGTGADYLQLFQCDVLHCIGIGLLVLHGLVFFFKTESRFYGMVLSTIVLVCFLTPLVWDVNFLEYLPAPLAQWCNGMHGSPFPLFPYVGFLFAGVVVSWEFLVAVESRREKRFMFWLAVVGGGLMAAGILFDLLPISLYPHYNYWYTSPNYFLVRAGLLLMLTSGIWYATHGMAQERTDVTLLGRESLFVYVLHLVVLYGSVVNPLTNLQTMIGPVCGIAGAIAFFLILTLVMFIAAFTWNYLKRRHLNLLRLLQLGGSAVFLYYFFTKDF